MNSCAIIAYTLSREFRERFENLIGHAPSYLTVPELRRMPLSGMLKTLRSLHTDHVYLPLEDDSSRCILPVMQAIAAVSSAGAIEVVYPDLRRKSISRWQALAAAGSFLCASSDAALAIRRCGRETNVLLGEERIPVSANSSSRIMYLNANLWFGVKAGGSVGHAAGVINALAGRGYDVEYVSAVEGVMLDPAVNVRPLVPPAFWGLPMEGNYYRFQHLVVEQAKHAAGSGGCRLIYQRMSVASYAGVILSRLWRVPLILEYNGSEAWVAKHWGRPFRYHDLAVAAEEVCLRHAHLVVTVSEVLRDELVQRGVEPARIVYYPNCIDPSLFSPDRFTSTDHMILRKRFEIASAAIVITFIGTFGRWHGVDVLARVIRKMVDEDSDWMSRNRVHFLLVGDGMMMSDVCSILAGERCRPFYTLAGLVPQKDAPLYLAASDIFVSPHVANSDGSRFFGSPTKLFEYMAMGKGIVASDLEQIGQILAPAVHANNLPAGSPRSSGKFLAVLTEPGNDRELIAGIRFLVEKSDWREDLGREARKEALARYTWDRHVSEILAAMDKVALMPGNV